MPPEASGSVVEPKDGRAWAIGLRAYGERHYVALGTSEEGWTREKAERKLGHVLADVDRGVWKPEAPVPDQAPDTEPTFHEDRKRLARPPSNGRSTRRSGCSPSSWSRRSSTATSTATRREVVSGC
jgi:hypothetical protein